MRHGFTVDSRWLLESCAIRGTIGAAKEATMGDAQGPEFVTIGQGAARLGVSERTVWELLRRQAVERYRLPGQGKTTFVRWADLERAYRTPRPIGPLGDDAKKGAA